MKDVFDLILPDEPDEIDRTADEDSAVERIKKEMASILERADQRQTRELNKKLTDEIKELIKVEIAKIKPVQKVVERTIEKKVIEPVHIEPKIIEAPPAPPQIIKETRVEIQVPKDDGKAAAELKALTKRVEDLTKELADIRREEKQRPQFVPGPGSRGIPNVAGHEGKTLQVVNGKAAWVSGGGGASLSGYTVNNGNELKTFDVSDVSLDQLARVVGSIIEDMQS